MKRQYVYDVELSTSKNRSFLDAEYVININFRDVPLIGELETDHEIGNAKREPKNNKVHAIGASRQITAFPLLGLVEKKKNSDRCTT